MKDAVVVVTRHQGLVEYLREEKLIPEDAEILPHASEDDVRGKHVIGVVPLNLAVLAERVTIVPLNFKDPSLRGVELTVDQVRDMAGPARTFQVEEV